jgi:hypothetical protein
MMTDEAPDLSVVEKAGVAFDPTAQHLDLTKDEKRRTTALLLAIQAYRELIIKDAAYLKEVHDEQRRSNDPPQIKPATIDAMIDAAIRFDKFIAGAPPELEDGDELRSRSAGPGAA